MSVTKSLLKTILIGGDASTLDMVSLEVLDNYFTDEVEIDLYTTILRIYAKTRAVPTKKLLLEYYSRENNTDEEIALIHAVTKRTVKSYKPEEVVGHLNILNREVVKEKLQSNLEYLLDKLESSSLSELEEIITDIKTEVITSEVNIEKTDTTELLLHSSHNALESFKNRYNERELNGGMKVCQYGYEEIDEVADGIKDIDYISIVGSTKQFKSTLARNFGYHSLEQVKNVLYITLEMSVLEIENSFGVIHHNNKERFPNNERITYKNASDATIEDKEAFFQSYQDLTESEDLGLLYILQPTQEFYGYDEFVADYHRINNAHMSIDLIILDSVNLMADSTMDVINSIIRKIRKFILREKTPVIQVSQMNRAGFKEALLSENNLYTLDAIRSFNEIESSSTMVISTFQSPEMRENHQVQLQHLLSRETALFEPHKTHVDAPIGVLTSLNQNQVDYSEGARKAVLDIISKDMF